MGSPEGISFPFKQPSTDTDGTIWIMKRVTVQLPIITFIWRAAEEFMTNKWHKAVFIFFTMKTLKSWSRSFHWNWQTMRWPLSFLYLGPKGQRRDSRGFWWHGPHFVLCQRGWWMTSLYALHQNKQGGSLDSWAFNSASNQRTCMWTPNKLSIVIWGECIQIEPGIVLFYYFGHMHSLTCQQKSTMANFQSTPRCLDDIYISV